MGMFECHRGHQFPTRRGTLICPECGLIYRQEGPHWVMRNGPEMDAYMKEVKQQVRQVRKAQAASEKQCQKCTYPRYWGPCSYKGELLIAAERKLSKVECPHRTTKES